LGFCQFVSDVRLLASAVQDPGNEKHPAYFPSYSDWFDEHTKVHFLGYSLGGLGCLAAFLKSRIGEKPPGVSHGGLWSEPTIDTCTLLCSGASFLDLDPRPLGFKQRIWDSIREYYYYRKFEELLRRRQRELADLEASASSANARRRIELKAQVKTLGAIRTQGSRNYRLFERLVLGEPWNSDELHRASNRILPILGGADRVVPEESLLRLRSESRQFCVLKVPGLTQEFQHTPEWEYWSRYVVSIIAHFLEHHPPDIGAEVQSESGQEGDI